MTLDTTIIIFAILGVVILLLLAWIIRLEIKLSYLRAGTSGKNLDEIMKQIQRALADLYAFKESAHKRMSHAEDKLHTSIRHVETRRFNPFEGTGTGGNQSFASVFVNDHGDGVVLSSLHMRDRVSMFSKPLSQFTSQHELTEEEKAALEKARARLAHDQHPPR